jgi:hypothetical protein
MTILSTEIGNLKCLPIYVKEFHPMMITRCVHLFFVSFHFQPTSLGMFNICEIINKYLIVLLIFFKIISIN